MDPKTQEEIHAIFAENSKLSSETRGVEQAVAAQTLNVLVRHTVELSHAKWDLNRLLNRPKLFREFTEEAVQAVVSARDALAGVDALWQVMKTRDAKLVDTPRYHRVANALIRVDAVLKRILDREGVRAEALKRVCTITVDDHVVEAARLKCRNTRDLQERFALRDRYETLSSARLGIQTKVSLINSHLIVPFKFGKNHDAVVLAIAAACRTPEMQLAAAARAATTERLDTDDLAHIQAAADYIRQARLVFSST